MKSTEWNWWGHEVGVGSSSMESQREMVKTRRRIEKAMVLVGKAIDVQPRRRYQRYGRVVGVDLFSFYPSVFFFFLR